MMKSLSIKNMFREVISDVSLMAVIITVFLSLYELGIRMYV